MIPGQEFTQEATTEVEIRINVVFAKCLLPQLESKLLCPTVEPAAETICGQERGTKTPIASGKYPLKKGHPRVMPFELNAIPPQLAAQEPLSCFGLL
jgi:hypothetical protein